MTFQGTPFTNHAHIKATKFHLIIIIFITILLVQSLICFLVNAKMICWWVMLICGTKITSLLTNRNSCRSICVACSINSLKCTNCSLHGLFLIHYHDKTLETDDEYLIVLFIVWATKQPCKVQCDPKMFQNKRLNNWNFDEL